MRPRTISGPLILILLGAAFLVHNVRPDLFDLRSIADYWPFLLIGFGLIGLFEALFHASRAPATQLPVRHYSSGWLWILIPLLVLAAASRRSQFDFSSFGRQRFAVFGEDYMYPVTSSNDVSGVRRIVLDNLRGDVTLRGEAGTKVTITGHKSIRAGSRSEADTTDRQSSVRIDREGDIAFIRAEGRALSDSTDVSTDLDIALPKNVIVESRTRAGTLSIDQLDGAVEIGAGRGDIRLSHIAGDVHIGASRGGQIHASDLAGALTVEGRGTDVDLANISGEVIIKGEFSGTLGFRALAKDLRFNSSRTELRAEAIPGSVSMDLGDLQLNNVTGPVRFHTTSRDIHATDVSGALDIDVNRGDIQISETRAPLPKMDVHARNGDIELTLPDKAAFDLDATTAQGDAENDYGEGVQSAVTGRRATLSRKSGGPQISVSTGRGAISVRKG